MDLNKALHIVWHDTCQYCNKKCEGKGHTEHIDPKSNGGRDDLSNLILACRKCNGEKTNLIIPEPYRGLLLARAKSKEKKVIQLLHFEKKKTIKKKNKPTTRNEITSRGYNPPDEYKKWNQLVRKHGGYLYRNDRKQLFFPKKDRSTMEELINQIFKKPHNEITDVKILYRRATWKEYKEMWKANNDWDGENCLPSPSLLSWWRHVGKPINYSDDLIWEKLDK